ncbi:hypothetical protein [Lonsdalea quercina]|uniref:hypothetical protein n=1 Tax=Lonsdalea quercina TaxID=71657 RepID=UPI0039750869
MIDSVKKLKHVLTSASINKNNQSDLNISDVAENYERYISDFKLAVELLGKTVEENDKIAIQCALTRVRISSLNLSNIYQDIIDDVALINKSDSWPAIPDGYQIPEHYNYPKK